MSKNTSRGFLLLTHHASPITHHLSRLQRSFHMSAVLKSSLSLRDMSLFRQQAFVGGRWEDGEPGQTARVINPANGEAVGTIPHMGAAETRRAIEAAERALP